jgi:hypothetical protein
LIDALPVWQQEICREVRELVHAADPDLMETIKRTNRPYFVLEGNICALQAAKDHVNIFLYDGTIVPDPEGIITGGHDNKTARRWPCVRSKRSIDLPLPPCSSTLLPTTALAAGERSSAKAENEGQAESRSATAEWTLIYKLTRGEDAAQLPRPSDGLVDCASGSEQIAREQQTEQDVSGTDHTPGTFLRIGKGIGGY